MTLAPVHAALAQTRIAVLPIEGPTGEKAWHEAQKAAKKVGEVVPQEEWDASAAKLFATSRSAKISLRWPPTSRSRSSSPAR